MTTEESIIEDRITKYSLIHVSLEAMKEYRNWSDSTISGYVKDVYLFEEFMYEQDIEPMLKSVKLYLVQKWIKKQLNEEIAFGTIKRRIASLSSIFSFYKDIGTISGNPFKAADLPDGIMNHHSPIMNMDQLKQVYRYLNETKENGHDIELTVKVMLFTGLRNQALTNLKVNSILVDQALLVYDAGIYNSKHKVQFFPIPPVLFSLIKKHIDENGLLPEDSLLYGLKGHPLQNKQLNRITDKICKELNWSDSHRITPHGFRATIATLLDERGNLGHDAIKFLLGHSEKDNIKYYLRRDQRKINQLRQELTLIEKELEDSLNLPVNRGDIKVPHINETEREVLHISEDILLKLLDSHPHLALSIIQKGFSHVNNNSLQTSL